MWLAHARRSLKAGAHPHTQWQWGVSYPSASWAIPAAPGSREPRSDAGLPRAVGPEAAALQSWRLHKHLPEFGGVGDLWANTYLMEKTVFLPSSRIQLPGNRSCFFCCTEITLGCRVVAVATRGFGAPRTGVQIPLLALPHLVTWNNSV